MRAIGSFLQTCDFGRWIGASARGKRGGVLVGVMLLLVGPAQAASGGPDGFGYTWADSNSGGPAYGYLVNGGAQALGLSDDGSSTVPIGFSFEFYGQVYSDVTVHANGGLSFDSSSYLSFTNNCPLASSSVSTLVAPFWDDLNPSVSSGDIYAGSGIHPTTGENVFSVEWWQIQHFDGALFFADDLTLEALLFEDGRIEFHYLDVDLDDASLDNGASASVGLIGSSTLSSSCDTPALSAGYAIGFFPPSCIDNDGDGACALDDCDDWNSAIYPGAFEVCDGADNDCDAQVDEGFDVDGDGITSCAGDCDDGNSAIYPGATEVCDGADNDCDAQNDEGFDLDADSWTSCGGDCDDSDPQTNPDMSEVCDGVDNDCNGMIDESFDLDGDGWTICEGDCDDWDSGVNPGAFDSPGDGIDQDCDGADTPVGDDDDTVADDDDTVADDDDTVADDDDTVADDDDTVADDDDTVADDDDTVADDDDTVADDDDSTAGGAEDYTEVSFGCGCSTLSRGEKNGRILVFLGLWIAAVRTRRTRRNGS